MAHHKDRHKRQTRLALSPLPSSSPATHDYHRQIQDRAASVRYERNSVSAKRRRMSPNTHSREDERPPLPTPEPASQHHGASPRSHTTLTQNPNTSSQSRSTSRQQRIDFTHTPPISSILAGSQNSSPPFRHLSISSSESDVEQRQRSHTAKRRRIGAEGGLFSSQSRMPIQKSKKGRALNTLSPDPTKEQSQSDDEEEDMPTTLGARRRNQQLNSSPSVAISHERAKVSEIIDHTCDLDPSEPSGEDERDEVEKEEDNSDDESDGLPVISKTKRLKRRKELTEAEQKDLDSDLDFLGNTSEADLTSPRQPRSTQSTQKTARARALEALKRKRSGQTDPLPLEQSEGDNHSSGMTHSDSGDLSGNDELVDDYVTVPTSSSRAMFEADEDDENFLDDDAADEDLVGVPEGMPIEFTRYASMKAKDLFKHAIEWMVQKKINPAFRAEDELYTITFKKLNDEVSGLVNSKFSSSIWTWGFRQSLYARQDLDAHEMPAGSSSFLLDHCEACNRKTHPASYEVRFHGKPYHPDSLDTVEQRDEEDDDDDDNDDDNDSETTEDDEGGDRSAVDYRGSKVPPSNKVYHVGRFCMANAETAHELQHWKKHLYDWVVNWLHNNGYLEPSKIVERDSWSTKKRRKKANKIADRMNDEGVVRRLWKEFSDSIARARDSKQSYH